MLASTTSDPDSYLDCIPATGPLSGAGSNPQAESHERFLFPEAGFVSISIYTN
jgi:hypothetical protein